MSLPKIFHEKFTKNILWKFTKKFTKNISWKSHPIFVLNVITLNVITFSVRNVCVCLAGYKLSILGDNFDNNIHNLLCASLDLCLVIISVSANNTTLHNYVIAKVSNILTTFWDNRYSLARLSQYFWSGCCLNWILIGMYQ